MHERVRRSRPALPPELAAQLEAVPKSVDGWGGRVAIEYSPCRVTLRSGEVRDRVYVVDADQYATVWGVDPEDDRGRSSVPLEEVVAVESSPGRLPAELASRIYEAGESGMGYCLFGVLLRDGTWLEAATGNAVDFLAWPPGIGPADVIDVEPGGVPGRRRGRPRRIRGAPYSWCLYSRP